MKEMNTIRKWKIISLLPPHRRSNSSNLQIGDHKVESDSIIWGCALADAHMSIGINIPFVPFIAPSGNHLERFIDLL